jgi:hypothetical protein
MEISDRIYPVLIFDRGAKIEAENDCWRVYQHVWNWFWTVHKRAEGTGIFIRLAQ